MRSPREFRNVGRYLNPKTQAFIATGDEWLPYWAAQGGGKCWKLERSDYRPKTEASIPARRECGTEDPGIQEKPPSRFSCVSRAAHVTAS